MSDFDQTHPYPFKIMLSRTQAEKVAVLAQRRCCSKAAILRWALERAYEAEGGAA